MLRNSCFRLLYFALALEAASVLLSAQTAPETVGRIEGEAIAVRGAHSVEVENGRSITLLGNGSEVTVNAGQARLVLADGGEIGVCGPAQFSLLKSGGTITLALNYGRVHARLEGSGSLILYTPQILATPVAIAGGQRETTLGLEASGAMCVVAAHGAVRLEQQLTGQALLVPQSGEVAFASGQLDSLRGASGSCPCDVPMSKNGADSAPRPREVSVSLAGSATRMNPPSPSANAEGDARPPEIKSLPKPASEEPIYKVLMPTLSFNASSPAPPPDPSPEMIVLVRRVRVRPAVVYHGRVASAPVPPLVLTAQAIPPPEFASSKKDAGVVVRVRNFFRRLWPGAGCEGAGCGRATPWAGISAEHVPRRNEFAYIPS